MSRWGSLETKAIVFAQSLLDDKEIASYAKSGALFDVITQSKGVEPPFSALTVIMDPKKVKETLGFSPDFNSRKEMSLELRAENDEFCKVVGKVIGDMGFEAKQAIVRKVVDTIFGTQLDIKVYGHLPINSSIIANIWKGDTQDVEFETSSRNSQSQNDNLSLSNQFEPNSTFLNSFRIPFEFTIPMSPPSVARVILERDEKGRIVKSETPTI